MRRSSGEPKRVLRWRVDLDYVPVVFAVVLLGARLVDFVECDLRDDSILERDDRPRPLDRVGHAREDERAVFQFDGVGRGKERRRDEQEAEKRESEGQRSTETGESEERRLPGIPISPFHVETWVREPCRAVRSGVRFHRVADDFGQLERAPDGSLADLLAAAEAVGHGALRLTGVLHLRMIAPRC
jgi:hypothetical protein